MFFLIDVNNVNNDLSNKKTLRKFKRAFYFLRTILFIFTLGKIPQIYFYGFHNLNTKYDLLTVNTVSIVLL